jgi:hypothetical protein
MLFACTGITLPYRTLYLERFVTSAHLVEVFNQRRNKEDDLNVCDANYLYSHFYSLFTQNCFSHIILR